MKEKFRREMFNFCVLCVLVLFTNALIAQTQDVYTTGKSWNTKGIKSITINPYDVNTRIYQSNDNTLKVNLTFEAVSDKEGEIEKLESFLENTLIQSNDDELRVTNQGAKKSTFVNDISQEKAKLVFDEGRVKLKTLDWKLMEIYLPENMDVLLDPYFCKVKIMAPIKGELSITNAFETQINAEEYVGNLTIEDGQFSKFYFGNVKKVNIEINDSDFTAESINECIMDSRFSDIQIGQCNELNYTGFEDKLEIANAEKVKIKCNFSDLNINNVEKISGELFEGSLQMNYCNDAVLIGKHTQVDVQNIRMFKIRDCYECDLSIDTLGSFYCLKGEFNELNIGYLKKAFSIESSQTEVSLLQTANYFEFIYLSGKFVEAEICIDKHSSYRLEAEVQFSEIELNKSDYKVELYDKELSDEKFIYHYGTDSKNANVRIKGYEMDVELNHCESVSK